MWVSRTSSGLGGGDDAAPALVAAVLPGLAVLDEREGLVVGEEPADRLGGPGEPGVVGVDQRAGDEGGHGVGQAACGERGLEGVEDGEADGSLGLRAAPVERDGRDDVRRRARS